MPTYRRWALITQTGSDTRIERKDSVRRFRKTNIKELSSSVGSAVASNGCWPRPRKAFWFFGCVLWTVTVRQYKCSKESKAL